MMATVKVMELGLIISILVPAFIFGEISTIDEKGGTAYRSYRNKEYTE